MIHKDESKYNMSGQQRKGNLKIIYNHYSKNLEASLYKDSITNQEKTRRVSKDLSNQKDNSKHTNIIKCISKQKEIKILTNEDSRIKSQLCSMIESVVDSDEDKETLRNKFGVSPYVVNMIVRRNSGLGIKPNMPDSDKKVDSKELERKINSKLSSKFNSLKEVNSFRRNLKCINEPIKIQTENSTPFVASNFLSVELMNIKIKDRQSSEITPRSLNSVSIIDCLNIEDESKIKDFTTNEDLTTIVKSKRSGATINLANKESQLQGSPIFNKEKMKFMEINEQTRRLNNSPKNQGSNSSKKLIFPRLKSSKTFVNSPKKNLNQSKKEKEEIENIVLFENYNLKLSNIKESQNEFKIELHNSSKDHFINDSPKRSVKKFNRVLTMKQRRDSKSSSDNDYSIKDSKNNIHIQLSPKKKSSLKSVKINESAKNQLEKLQEEIRGNININNTKKVSKSISKATDVLNEFDSDEEDEKNMQIAKEENRKITKKGLVYDSYSDEEEDELNYEIFYIHPDSHFRFVLDFLIFLCSFYSMVVTPLILAFYNTQSFEFRYSHFCVEIFVDCVYLLDLISGFFKAYLDFEERLITSHKKMILNYAYGYMLLDFISAMPFNTIISAKTENNLWGNGQKYSSYIYENSDWKLIRLLIAIRYIKLVKVFSQNKFLEFFKSMFFIKKINLSGTFSRLLKFVTYFYIVSHLLACMWIYLGRVDYPNWMFFLDMQDFDEIEIYISGFYFILSTIFTIGYGDIVSKNAYERVFNILLLMVGILIYSYAVSSLSNIIQFVDEPTKRYLKRTEYLNELRIKYNLPSTVSDKIVRFLRYELNNNKGDKNNFLAELPKSLKNEMILRMYRPMIDSFIFFKNFENVDFIIQVIMLLKPMSAIKNERLVKEGDFIEEIIFVKSGALVLEIGIKVVTESDDFSDILKYKYKFLDPLNNNGAPNNLHHVLKKGINNYIRDRHNNGEAVHSLDHWNEEDEGGKLFDNQPALHYIETQYLKIIELRRNEHYGDVLMFLNRRSPLSVRVKTKSAELFLMKKTDVVNISLAFPEIFEEVTRKSAYNQKQLDWLIKKTKDIFFENHREEFLTTDNSIYNYSKNNTRSRSKLQNTNTQFTKKTHTRNSTIHLQKTLTRNSLKETQINQGPIILLRTKSFVEDLQLHSENSSNTDSSGLKTQKPKIVNNHIDKNKSIITEYEEEENDYGSAINSSKHSNSYQKSFKKTKRLKSCLESPNNCLNNNKSKICYMSNNSNKSKESIRVKESFIRLIPTKTKKSIDAKFSRDCFALSPKFKSIKNSNASSEKDITYENDKKSMAKFSFKNSNKYIHVSKRNFLLEDCINSEMEDEHIRSVSYSNINCVLPYMSNIRVPIIESSNISNIRQNSISNKLNTVHSSSNSSIESYSHINKIVNKDEKISNTNYPSHTNSHFHSFKDGMVLNTSYPIMYNFNINNNYNFDNRGSNRNIISNSKFITKCPNCNTISVPISDNRQLLFDSNINNFNLFNSSNKNSNLSMNNNFGQHLSWSNIETSANSSFSILSSSSRDEKHEKKISTSESPPHLRYLDFLSLTKLSKLDLNKDSSNENTQREIIKNKCEQQSPKIKLTSVKSNKSLYTQITPTTIKNSNRNLKNITNVEKNMNFNRNINSIAMSPMINGRNLQLNDRRQSALQIFWDSKEAFINKNQTNTSNCTQPCNQPSQPAQPTQPSLAIQAKNPGSTKSLPCASPILYKTKPINKLLLKKSKMTDGVMMQIHKNIEKSSLNLNDPQFFYSEFFHDVMNKKHDNRKKRRDIIDNENLNKRLEIVEKLLSNFK